MIYKDDASERPVKVKGPFIFSGILGFIVWTPVMLAGVMLTDSPNAPLYTDVLRWIAVVTVFLPPLVWIVALVSALGESNKKNRPRVLRAWILAPYAAACVHALALIALFNLT